MAVTPDFTIKRNDLLPVIEAVLSDANGPVNLSDPLGTTVKFVMVRNGQVTPIINTLATIENGPAGEVSYAWVSGDTAVDGFYSAEWHVYYSGGDRTTFPNDRTLLIQIVPDLASP